MFRAIRQQMDELGCQPDYRISSLTKLADLREGDRQFDTILSRSHALQFIVLLQRRCSMVQSSEAADRSRVAKRHLVAYLSPLDAAEHEGLGGRSRQS